MTRFIRISVLTIFVSTCFLFSAWAANESYAKSKKAGTVVSKPAPKTSQMVMKSVDLGLGGTPDPMEGPLTIKFINPTSNANVSGVIDMRADARGGGVGSVYNVTFSTNNDVKTVVNGKQVKGTIYGGSWDSHSLPDGKYTMMVVLGNFGGKPPAIEQIPINILNHPDNTPPLIKIDYLKPNQEVSGKFTVGATATDDVGIVKVDFSADGKPIGAGTSAGNDAFMFSWWETTNWPDGPVTLNVTAYDKSGKTGTDLLQLKINNHGDKTPPTVTILSPKPNDTFNLGEIKISADAKDETALDRVEFYGEQNVFLGKVTNAPFELTWDTNATKASKGAAGIRVVAYDKAGNSAEAKVTIYLENPKLHSVKVTVTPQDGATVNGKVTVSAECQPMDNVDHVNFSPGGGADKKINGGNPFEFVWDLSKEPNGDKFLSIVAMEQNDGYLGEAAVTYHVQNPKDMTPPSCEIIAPGDGDEVKGDVLVKVSATDDQALDNVQIYPNYQQGIIPGQSFPNPPYEMSWDSTKFQDGDVVPIVAVAVDRAGNETKSSTVKVKVLNNPWHQITFDIKPTPDSMVKGMVTLSVTCKPNDSKVDAVEFGGGGKRVKGGNPFEYEWNTEQGPNGPQGFTISALDNMGQQIGAQSYNWDVEN